MGGDLFARWTGSAPFGLSFSKSWLDTDTSLAAASGAALSPRRATYCSFASPKESRQRKGDPGVCVPSLRFGQPAVLAPSGVELELAALKQSLALIRLKLRSSAHSQGFWGRVRDRIRVKSHLNDAIIFIAACARITGARGLKHLYLRGATWFLGSDRNFAAKHPQGATKARRIWALTPKMPDSESVSAFAPVPIPNAVWQG